MNSPDRPKVPAILLVSGILLLVWWILLQTMPKHDTLANYLFNIAYGSLYVAGAGIAWLRARGLGGWRSAIGRAALLIAGGMLANALGQFIWGYYNIFGGIEVPDISVADVAWYLSYPLYIAGLALFLKQIPARFDLWRVTMAVLGSVAIGVILFFLLLPGLTAEERLINNIINVGYMVADIAILSVTMAAITVWGGALGVFLRLFVAGTIINAVADVIYAYLAQADLYWNGSWSDLLYAVGAFLEVLAVYLYLPNPQRAAEVLPPTS